MTMWSMTMDTPNDDLESACREHLVRFFVAHPDAALEERAMRAVRFLRLSDKPLGGKAEGWAAGSIYAVASHDRQACGVPGLLNSEFEAIMGVSMGTARMRAAQVERLMAF
jgi:hypothetical protein